MYNKIAMTALIAAALAQPAYAASLDAGLAESGQQANGAFAGARLRLSLGARPKASAALAIAPIGRSVGGDGSVRTRFGEGLSFGTGANEPVAFRLAGTRVDRLHLASNGKVEDGTRKHGISTAGYVAIGVGVLVVAALALYVGCGTGEICNVDDE